jgi:hypothetical protein
MRVTGVVDGTNLTPIKPVTGSYPSSLTANTLSNGQFTLKRLAISFTKGGVKGRDAHAADALEENKKYRIEVSGTGVNWTSIGASSGNVGTIFTKNATNISGSGGRFSSVYDTGTNSGKIVLWLASGDSTSTQGTFSDNVFETWPLVYSYTDNFNVDVLHYDWEFEAKDQYGQTGLHEVRQSFTKVRQPTDEHIELENPAPMIIVDQDKIGHFDVFDQIRSSGNLRPVFWWGLYKILM